MNRKLAITINAIAIIGCLTVLTRDRFFSEECRFQLIDKSVNIRESTVCENFSSDRDGIYVLEVVVDRAKSLESLSESQLPGISWTINQGGEAYRADESDRVVSGRRIHYGLAQFYVRSGVEYATCISTKGIDGKLQKVNPRLSVRLRDEDQTPLYNRNCAIAYFAAFLLVLTLVILLKECRSKAN